LNFISPQFLFFGIVTLFIYWTLKDRFKPSVLLIASYIFYCFWDWRFTSLLLFLTVSNFYLTKKMYKIESRKLRQYLLTICLIQNLLVLFVFKYFNFFVDGLQKLFDHAGFNLDLPTIQILLPLGLSFFIFQTSSYIIDVFRGTIVPEKSFINFATFVVYFPHMAAGPIMPAKILLPQISAKKVAPNFEQVQSAIFLIVVGLFRKIVIADTLAPVVNRILGSPSAFDWKSIFLASIGFGLQIYGDFAGYSSIARGVSRLFGIEMMVNFRQPYLSTSITEFWRRWHISLSSWFRDYLYIPLGGNRGKPYKTYLNLLIVMVIAGLWHGAALGFLVWGFLHGLFLVADKKFKISRPSNKILVSAIASFGWIITQVCVFFAWIFFRNPNLSEAFSVINSLLQRRGGVFEISDALLVSAALVVSFSLDLAEIYLGPKLNRSPAIIKGLVLGAFLVVIFTMKSSSVIPFIYFRF
jgi:alginate O-acetyltransferase complex protein AlgI